MSHHTSRIDSIACEEMRISMYFSNASHPESWYGSPAVGSASNTFER
jgi:hypothetical protein